MIDKEWFIEEYDKTLLLHGADGATLAETREAVVQSYVDAVRAGDITPDDIPLEELAGIQFDQSVRPARNSRRVSFRRELEELLDILRGDTILGDADPKLDRAYPLGTADGRDKTLRFWTTDDWQESITERYRNAADVTESAKFYDTELASEFVRLMRQAKVQTTGDLFDRDEGMEAVA